MAIGPYTLQTVSESALLGYYNTRFISSTSPSALAVGHSSAPSAPAVKPPWQIPDDRTQTAKDAKILSTKTFIDTSDVPRSPGSTAASKLNQDNEKLFALYKALNTLSQLAAMSQRTGATTGQLNGYDARFQQGFAEVQDFLTNTTFNNFTLQATKPSSTITSTASLASAKFTYTGATITTRDGLQSALPGLSASDSFTIGVKKGGVTTDVTIDLSQVAGDLTLDNVLAYTNSQLQAAGFNSRLARVQTAGDPLKPETHKFAISLKPAASEQLTLSAAGAAPALYIAGNTGSPAGTVKDPADQQTRLLKLSNLGGALESEFSAQSKPDTGTTSAHGTVVDANGDVYVLGVSTGSFGSEIVQSSQDVYLAKYDSAGNLKWQELVGSGEAASAGGIALDPTGGVVITGATTGHLTQTAISNGNQDSFAAKFDALGNQVWLTQIQTLAKNETSSVSVDATGNVYLGGKVSGGVIGAGQTALGGGDAFLAKLTNKGHVTYVEQLGTAGADRITATALTASGDLIVSSVQNGRAIVAKYAGGDATAAPVWQTDLGDLASGDLGGIAISGSQIYISGTTQNGALNAGGLAQIATPNSGGQDAFVFALTDNGASVTPDHISYVGTGASDKGAGVSVGPDGTIYLVGTTTGTFASESRTAPNKPNLFLSALANNGSILWAHQYGGVDAQSQGAAIAIDTTGSSVLDILGLPKGTVTLAQPTTLASRTTLREGDSFSIKIDGASDYTTKITIGKDETMRSLAAKITRGLLLKGKASVTYANHGQALKIELNPGVTATLVAGPKDFDALGRLGIAPGILTSPPVSGQDDATSKDGPQVFGLGFTGRPLDIASKTHAGITKGQILVAMSAITEAYRKSNGLETDAAGGNGAASSAPPGAQAKLANYQIALSMLQSAAAFDPGAGASNLLGIG